ncbi:MAG: hypothetical protein FWB74_10035 [Defluviitaleaceae bacterium]|nr:hypothetical protein [Defluviitaleaceae bacterium]
MGKTVEIGGVKYMLAQTTDKIALKRYNESHKMRVNLYFPKGSKDEGAEIENAIIQVLSNQYIERNARIDRWRI